MDKTVNKLGWTPEEARWIQCPLMQRLCIGPKCMAWRWIQPQQAEVPIERGYCGLAGRDGILRPDTLS